MKFLIFYLCIAAAQSAEKKAEVCFACHGQTGISPSPLWPNLAGQKESYLINSLKAYREGKRYDSLMSPISKTLTDEDISELAEYFSSKREQK